MLFPHRVMLHPSIHDSDLDGNSVRRPADVGIPSPAFIQPVAAHENLVEPHITLDAVCFLPATAPLLDAFSVIVWEGRRFELVGEALAFKDPHHTLTHSYARLRTM